MDIIYALARKVHVWLGPATDEEIDSVWPIFRTGDPEPGFSFMDEAYITIFHQTQDKKVWSRCSDETTSFSLCVKKFFHRAWFTRRWILQEVSLAREVIVHCGFHEVPWVRFHQGAHFHRSLLDSGQRKHGVCSFATVARQALETIESMETSRAQKKDYVEGMERNPYHGIKRVLWLLEQYHRANCVDERDRLYALYGLLLSTKLPPLQVRPLMRVCPVNYNIHFSHIYTDFAAAAVKSGHGFKVLAQVIEFGGLSQQDECWPSWVPSWNTEKTMEDMNDMLTVHTKNPRFSPDVSNAPERYYFPSMKLGAEDTTMFIQVSNSRALRFRGSTDRICEVQPSTCRLDLLASLNTMLGRRFVVHQFVVQASAISRDIAAWLVIVAIINAPTMLSRPCIEVEASLTTPRVHDNFKSRDYTEIHKHIRKVFGLPLEEEDPKWKYGLDHDSFVSEARRVLQGLYPFRYEHEGCAAFGIAFAEVQTGDFVFRTAEALSHKDEDGVHMPPVSGLIIRPYHQASPAGPATFRLVSMCFAYCHDVEEPELVEVVLV